MRRLATTSLAIAALTLGLSACSMSRVYIGSPLPADRTLTLIPGESTMAQVLEAFGAPNRIVRGPSGEIFVYRYSQRNTDTLKLEEPVITNFEFFSYSVVEQKEDRLVVLFDRAGVVRNYGLSEGRRDFESEDSDR